MNKSTIEMRNYANTNTTFCMKFLQRHLFVLSLSIINFSAFPINQSHQGFLRSLSSSSRKLKAMSEKAFGDSAPPYLDALPYPSVVHKMVPENETPSRLIVVGDVHGCFDELQELLEKCDFQAPDTKVLLVGDLINKGPKSREVLRFAKENNFLCIRGNHDDFILAVILNLLPDLKKTDGIKFIEELTSDEVEWLKDLPYTISIPKLQAVFVHAGLLPSLSLEAQGRGDMTTLRNVYFPEDSSECKGTSRPDLGRPWIVEWDEKLSPAHVYFGHDAKRGLQLGKFATGLDTGCLYGKHLTAMILPARQIVQVSAKKEYVVPGGKD